MNDRIHVRISGLLAAALALAAGLGAPLRARGQSNIVKSLTLQECVDKALQNNLGVQIQQINPDIQQWGIVHAQGAFDPVLSGLENYTDDTAPGSPSIESKQLQTTLGLAGKLPIGMQYNLIGTDSRFSGTLTSNFVYTGTSAISLTQPLLKNFWIFPNVAPILVVRKSKAIAQQQFLLQVINTISDTEKAYYELVFAIEDHKAKVEGLTLARELLEDNRKRLQIGVMSRLDVIQAEAGMAENVQATILAERTIKDNENALKLQISQNVAEYRGVSFVPINYPLVEMVETDTALSTRTALELRPDYLAAQHTVEQQNIQVKFNRNQLWPEIDLQGSYGLNGAGHTFSSFTDDLGSGDNPVWTIGVTASIPIGNRQARANYETARLQSRQALLQLKSLEQQIIVAVDNAVGHVRSNLQSVEAARAASRLAEESLKAEKTKLLTGTSTTFLVLQAQSQLIATKSAQVRAEADYNESLIDLARTEGSTLRKKNIVIKFEN